MSWDPSAVRAATNVTPLLARRVKKECMEVCRNPPAGIFAETDETDFTLLHAIVMGPEDTPYEGGFFYFICRFPSNYPFSPPLVKLMTTAGGAVRFNPNLYSCGKVCLSILGTWSGPPWTAANTISSALISIQSLMSDNPYSNEPGREKMKSPQSYLHYLQHETIRVAVVGALDNDFRLSVPAELKKKMEQEFLRGYDNYERLIMKNLHLNGTVLFDSAYPSGASGKFIYAELQKRLRAIRARLAAVTNGTAMEVDGSGDRRGVIKTVTDFKSDKRSASDVDDEPLVKKPK